MLSFALASACGSAGPCFGLEQGATYTITVLDRQDANSRFGRAGAPYDQGANACGDTLALADGLTLDVKVIRQSGERCANSVVQVGFVPHITFVDTFADGAAASSDSIFGAGTIARAGACEGGWDMQVVALNQEPEHGDPFRASTEGQRPAVIMQIGFRPLTLTPDCVAENRVLSTPNLGGMCVDAYVVQVGRK